MHILITRPEPDATETGTQLESLGHKVMIEPMLRVEPQPIDGDAFEGAQALIATSRNALRALILSAAQDAARDHPLYVVGPATAELAIAMGFLDVREGRGSGRDLAELIAGEADPANGRMVHLAGETLAFDLAAALAEHGLAVDTLTTYRTVAATSLSASTIQQLRAGGLEAAILMSPRTASVFAKLLRSADLSKEASRLTCICLSKEVANALEGVSPGRIEIAREPNSTGILAAVGRVASRSPGV
jgi:uroporphyrinogen-III synthase